MSLRDQILSATDCVTEAIEVPEWGCTVYVRSITAKELDSWQCETYVLNGANHEVNRQNLRCRLLVRCLVDEAGQRIFADDQAHELGAKNNKIVQKLFAMAERINLVSSKDVEDLAKNS